MTKRALFLDRDGVINVDHGYVHRKEHFEFIDGIFELVAEAVARNFLVIIVTNQAGIGRGYYTEEQFQILMEWVRSEFARRAGRIDDVYFCPYHPEHGIGPYKCQSPMRKPGPGMIRLACKEHDIDPSASLLVGDNITDMLAGIRAGVGINLLYSPNVAPVELASGLEAVERISSLREAITYLD